MITRNKDYQDSSVPSGNALAATVLVLPILTGRWHPGRGSGVIFLVLYGSYIVVNGYWAGLYWGG